MLRFESAGFLDSGRVEMEINGERQWDPIRESNLKATSHPRRLGRHEKPVLRQNISHKMR